MLYVNALYLHYHCLGSLDPLFLHYPESTPLFLHYPESTPLSTTLHILYRVLFSHTRHHAEVLCYATSGPQIST
jgi:hypothetical protein